MSQVPKIAYLKNMKRNECCFNLPSCKSDEYYFGFKNFKLEFHGQRLIGFFNILFFEERQLF